MKIRITGRGIYGINGEVPIGTELTVKEAPAGWRGRYVVVSGNPKEDAVAITNPAPAAGIDPDLDDITQLRKAYHEETGGHADKRWKEDTLREKIAEALGDGGGD